jgi:DNA-binding LacI/PurR family transcriptional regulator
MATLKEVAALAGVSTATASLALNGGAVGEISRQRVISAARKLKYVPNKVGRMLITGRSNMIEMVIMTAEGSPNIVHATSLLYYLMLGVLEVSDSRGYGVRSVVKSLDDADIIEHFETLVGDRSADGVVIIPQFARDYQFLTALNRASYPHVLLAPTRFGGAANRVDIGDYDGGRLVGRTLLASGARRIAMINGPREHLCAIERERGLMDELVLHGATIVAKRYGDYTIESGVVAMNEIIGEQMPDAVFCANDYMAAGAMQHLHAVGLEVPRDVAVIGYDDADLARALRPPLTTVDNRFLALGKTLADEVIAQIQGETPKLSRPEPPEMRLRDSHQFGRRTGEPS